MNRRTFIQQIALLLAANATGMRASSALAAPTPLETTDGRPFSTAWLKEHARHLGASKFRAPASITSPELVDMSWDRYQDIQFRPDHGLWADQGLAFQLRFFHLGRTYLHPVTIFEVVDGRVLPVSFSPEMFDYGDSPPDKSISELSGFAGFRIHYQSDFERDMAAFLGASYFRAVDWRKQYGLSVRGLAINTVFPGHEEFPLFKTFWIERPAPGQTNITIHALLDSPSVAGAYRFVIRPGRSTLMDVESTLYPREKIRQLGLAPLTSMYHHGENDRRVDNDFRPEVHDSDGLAMVRGNGERFWRPLANPAKFRVNTYFDENPRGFGLLQRDRHFQNYQDDGVYYDRRPNLWVEPRGAWGRGAIGLVEIPADEEIIDNIVAFWIPERSPEPGEEFSLAYRLHWSSDVPDNTEQTGRVIATRLGLGGIPGQERSETSCKFVIDFAGGSLDLLEKGAKVEPVITVSKGRIEKPAAYLVEELSAWRAIFDLHWDDDEPIDLRCYLRLDKSALTETWGYLWAPPD